MRTPQDLEDQIARAERLGRAITDELTVVRLRQFAQACRNELARQASDRDRSA